MISFSTLCCHCWHCMSMSRSGFASHTKNTWFALEKNALKYLVYWPQTASCCKYCLKLPQTQKTQKPPDMSFKISTVGVTATKRQTDSDVASRLVENRNIQFIKFWQLGWDQTVVTEYALSQSHHRSYHCETAEPITVIHNEEKGQRMERGFMLLRQSCWFLLFQFEFFSISW